MADATTQRNTSLDELCINTIRTLAMDGVQKANSGHPGTPMALAPLAYRLWTRHLRHNPADPNWPGRDRFVLSCGHASMLLYSLLYLSGYDLPLEELKNFRQWNSRTPGHPEFAHTAGVETTTGPLGQGVGNAIGMAVAEAHLAAVFNRPGHGLIDHRTWFIASDGDLMEGISHEAASLAGHLRLGKLIGFYDDNRITIEGATELAFSEDVAQRFEAYGWSTHNVQNGNDLEAIDRAIFEAQSERDRPSLIIVRTHIAYGSPNKQDTAEAHGAPLGEDEIKLTKENLGWEWQEPFHVPQAALAEWRRCRNTGAKMQAAWEEQRKAYGEAHAESAIELERRLQGVLPSGWDSTLPAFQAGDPPLATRAASGKVLNALAAQVPELVGGSADLAPSNNTFLKGLGDFGADDYASRNMHFGIREHGMAAIMNGMALHGAVIPYGGTFLVFSDYMRPAIRLAALMGLHVIYVFTHDSIGLGEDGPTHQPIEALPALRCIPNLTLLRPGDSAETVAAWRVALEHRGGPVALALTRQKLPHFDHSTNGDLASAVARGGYVLQEAPASKPQVLLMSSGSEVALAVEAGAQLQRSGIDVRVVSMPSLELFARQSKDYRDRVLPPSVHHRVAIEAAQPMSWFRWIGDSGEVVGLERFGASAPYEQIYENLGLSVASIVDHARRMVSR